MLILISFLKGYSIGFVLAIPVGPVALLCIQRTLLKGMVSGLVSGLGIATADVMYSTIAVFGVHLVANIANEYGNVMKLGASMYLFLLGVRVLRARIEKIQVTMTFQSLFPYYVSTLGLSLANPLTILAFAGIFASVGINPMVIGAFPTFFSLVGVFLGFASWWLILTLVITYAKRWLRDEYISFINVFSGAGIILFSLYIFIVI